MRILPPWQARTSTAERKCSALPQPRATSHRAFLHAASACEGSVLGMMQLTVLCTARLVQIVRVVPYDQICPIMTSPKHCKADHCMHTKVACTVLCQQCSLRGSNSRVCAAGQGRLGWKESSQRIDKGMLMSRDPILFYAEVPLYVSELDDNGASQLSVKVQPSSELLCSMPLEGCNLADVLDPACWPLMSSCNEDTSVVSLAFAGRRRPLSDELDPFHACIT